MMSYARAINFFSFITLCESGVMRVYRFLHLHPDTLTNETVGHEMRGGPDQLERLEYSIRALGNTNFIIESIRK